MLKTPESKEASEKLVKKAEIFLKSTLIKSLPPQYLYHNYDHSKEVADACRDYAKKIKLPEDQAEQLILAAWFHDIGYIKGAKNHEIESAAIARQFLEERNYDETSIKHVETLILSTQHDVPESTELEKVLHDASWSFLGRKKFFDRARLLLLEREYTEGRKFTLSEMNQIMLDMQMSKQFYTNWANENFSSRRIKNIATQTQKLVKAQDKDIRKVTGKNFGRGVDTVYRVTLRNHINLSAIADGKASMLISINTLVLSIIITIATAGLSVNSSNLSLDTKFIFPIFLLMSGSLSAIIFAVLSTIPKVSSSKFDIKDVEEHKISLLYFGNFLKLEKDNFVNYLRELKKDQEILYDDLSRDLYNLGAVLSKKYKMLSYAYYSFVGGLILSVLLFVIVFFIL